MAKVGVARIGLAMDTVRKIGARTGRATTGMTTGGKIMEKAKVRIMERIIMARATAKILERIMARIITIMGKEDMMTRTTVKVASGAANGVAKADPDQDPTEGAERL
jgi:hypothetical protein